MPHVSSFASHRHAVTSVQLRTRTSSAGGALWLPLLLAMAVAESVGSDV